MQYLRKLMSTVNQLASQNMTSMSPSKPELRKSVRQLLAQLTPEQMAAEGLGCRVYVPVVKDRDANMQLLHIESTAALVPVPPFSILEPSPTYPDGTPREEVISMDAPLDLLLMPGLAFDRKGGRLGRGGGYYDKFIANCQHKARHHGHPAPLLVALAYQAQMVAAVPMAPTDIPVDVLVTAAEVVACSERGLQAMQ